MYTEKNIFHRRLLLARPTIYPPHMVTYRVTIPCNSTCAKLTLNKYTTSGDIIIFNNRLPIFTMYLAYVRQCECKLSNGKSFAEMDQY